MNTAATQGSAIRYYTNRQSVAVWGALVTLVGVISVGGSLAEHSLATTSAFLLGTVVVWYLGYWALSSSCYFISSTKAGFKDFYRTSEVQFDEVRSVTKSVGRHSITLVFVCNTRTVTMPLDTIDEAWFSAVKVELQRRGVTVS